MKNPIKTGKEITDELKNRIKTPLEINIEIEEAFKKYEVID